MVVLRFSTHHLFITLQKNHTRTGDPQAWTGHVIFRLDQHTINDKTWTDRVESFETSADGGAVLRRMVATLYVEMMENDVDEQRQPRDVLHRQDEERLQRQTLSLGCTLQSRQSHQELRLLPDVITRR